MRAKVIGAAVLPLLLLTEMAASQDHRCEAPDYFVQPYFKTAIAAQQLRTNKSLDIMVLSSMPSQTRSGEKLKSYPSFLEGALKERLPNYEIRISIHSEARKSIHDIVAALPAALEKNKPSLVVWQTGTVEALMGMDPDKFERKLERGIEIIRASGADVVLVNPQFSPRTSFISNSGALNERIRRVAAYSDVSLFNRYDLMRHWSENEAFDFAALKNDGTFEAVHRCLGGLLAEYLSRAASFPEIAKLRQ